METLKPIQIFYCYASKDKKLQEKLEEHLSPLKRKNNISTWSDREIEAGTDWAVEIEAHMNTANIILLLVSPSFIASDFCYSVQMQKAIEMQQVSKTRIIPIILRSTLWVETPIGKLQGLPKNNQPITQWRNRDKAFLDVVIDLWIVIKGMYRERSRILTEEINLAGQRKRDEREKVFSELESFLSEAEMLNVRKWLAGFEGLTEQIKFALTKKSFSDAKELYRWIETISEQERMRAEEKGFLYQYERVHRLAPSLGWKLWMITHEIEDVDLELLNKARRCTKGLSERNDSDLLKSWEAKLVHERLNPWGV